MKRNLIRLILIITHLGLIACAATQISENKDEKEQTTLKENEKTFLIEGSPFGSVHEFTGSPFEEIGTSGLFDVHTSETCLIAVLPNGDDSFAARIQTLKKADTSVLIQALIFTGDESGLYIAELLKEKKSQGLDVRVIIDAVSNPGPQTQSMYFDLKQHGIEVEGYETFYLQWLNEVPLARHDAPDKTTSPNKRFHEKMWIIDGETDHGIAIVGGLNIGNEYFRVDPKKLSTHWRDQDVIVKGDVVKDMVATFERNFEYSIKVKNSRGVFNTNKYWENARKIFEKTGKIGMRHKVKDQVNIKINELAAKKLNLKYEKSKCRFFQNRPRFGETFIEQAYLKAIQEADDEILIANAYFIPSIIFIETVKRAARRCAKVTILTNSPETNDLPLLTMVGRDFYDEILVVNTETQVQSCDGGGVQIWEWQGRRAKSTEQTQGTMHAKYAVIDRYLSIVGSHNLDPRSRQLNSETVIVFENEILSQQLANTFYGNDLDFSKQITLEETNQFNESGDAVYKFQKEFGILIKDQL